jgi:hypothetical protein
MKRGPLAVKRQKKEIELLGSNDKNLSMQYVKEIGTEITFGMEVLI